MSSTPSLPDRQILDALVHLFYSSTEEVGRFDPSRAEALPPAFRRLLAHESHMTVTLEAFYHSSLDVQVLTKCETDQHYARRILLTRQSDGGVVQFGVMRVNSSHLSDAVRQEIETESHPLGRILISHDVLRKVELDTLWRVRPAVDLRRLLNMDEGQETYGRTALIHVEGEPAVELLEIVAPVT